nr:amidohydrolase family protein [Jatrophihabitans endophyticus]
MSPRSTAVHATHLAESDRQLLREHGVTVCMCPTTERDLADGVGSARTVSSADVPLSLGTDQNAVIDFFEEARALEMDERLATGRRGHFRHAELLEAMVNHRSLGWDDAGALVPGMRADLVAVRLDTPRTAGCPADEIVFAAGAGDVDTVVIDGRVVVQGGRHRLGDVGALLDQAIGAAWQR